MWRGPRGNKEGGGPGVFLELSLGGLGGGQVGVGGGGRLSRDVASGLALSPWAGWVSRMTTERRCVLGV